MLFYLSASMRSLRNPLFFLAIAGIVLLFLQRTTLFSHETGTDFAIYNEAAHAFRNNPAALYNVQVEGFDQYLYPPPGIVLFVLFSYLPAPVAYALLAILMLSCFIAFIPAWRKLCSREHIEVGKLEIGLMGIFFGCSAAFIHNIALGQINTLVLLLSILYLLLLPRKPVLAGIFLAAAIWIKVYPVLLCFGALRTEKGRKALLSCVLTGAAILVILLPFVPFSLYPDFIRKLGGVSQVVSTHVINQSFTAFLQRFTLPLEKILGWPNIYPVLPWIKWLNYLALATMLGWIVSRRLNHTVSGALLLALIPVFSTLGWGHTYIFALPVWMIAFHQLTIMGKQKVLNHAVLIVMGLLLLVPVHNAPGMLQKLPFVLQNLYYSRILLVTLICIFIVVKSADSGRRFEAQSSE